MSDVLTLAARVEAGMAPRVANEHHYYCSSRRVESAPCDCYGRKTNDAFAALAELVERTEKLEAVLRFALDEGEPEGHRLALRRGEIDYDDCGWCEIRRALAPSGSAEA